MATDQEQQERNVEDAGFEIKSFPTSTKGFRYEAEVPQADSWKLYYEFWKQQGENPDEVLTGILNAQNKQTGTQSPKSEVREVAEQLQKDGEPFYEEQEATDENGEPILDDDGEPVVERVMHPALAEAVAKANESSRGYVLGAPRAGGGGGARHETGLTKKEREAFGTAVATAMVKQGGALTDEDQREIAESLGIDPDLLGL